MEKSATIPSICCAITLLGTVIGLILGLQQIAKTGMGAFASAALALSVVSAPAALRRAEKPGAAT